MAVLQVLVLPSEALAGRMRVPSPTLQPEVEEGCSLTVRDREANARGRQEAAEVTGGLGCLVLIRMWSKGDVQLLALALRCCPQ